LISPENGQTPQQQEESLASDSSTDVIQASSTVGAPQEEAVVTAPVARYYALLVGAGLTLLGVLGFIPPLTRGGALFDVMRVTPTANVLHLITGLAGLVVWKLHKRLYDALYAVGIGFVYLIYFSFGNIRFGNLEGTVALDTFTHTLQWVTYNALHAGLMVTGWLVGALAAMQRGDRATRRYRRQRRWSWLVHTRIPSQ
jgi:Domain of unknown function (DUF4383)